MMRLIRAWLLPKWRHLEQDPTLPESYRLAFGDEHGRRVLHHLLDSVYCTVYEGTDPAAALAHNSARRVVHELLRTLDLAEHPDKYHVEVQTEMTHGR